MSETELIENVLKRLERMEELLAEALAEVRAAVAAAEKSADAATNAVLAFDALNTRFELLRQEHVGNHPGSSHVPSSLLKKPSE